MSAVLTAASPVSPWRGALPAALLAALVIVVLYRDTFLSMVSIWSRSDTYAHAFLVPPIVAWLVYRQREALRRIAPSPRPLLLLTGLLPVLGWVMGDMGGVNALTHFSVVALLVLVVPAVLGTAVARHLAFPLAFTFFMVPIGDFALPWFMQWTADFTVASLRLLGVPVYREGLSFVIPSGSWSVVEACSGVRYLIASFMVGTLFAYLQFHSPWRRLAFSLVALVVPVVANWVRALMIVLLGHLSDNRLAAGVDHLIYGWVFFGIVIGLMFLIGARWTESATEAEASTMPRGPATARVASAWWTAAGLVALAALPALVAFNDVARAGGDGHPAITLVAPQGLTPTESPVAFRPAFSGAATQRQWVFETGDARVAVHVAYFRHQRVGHKLVSWDHSMERQAGNDWRVAAVGTRSLSIGDDKIDLRTAELVSGRLAGVAERRVHLRQILWSGGRLTASDTTAAWHGVRARLGGRGDDAAAITFHLESDDPPRAEAALDRFVARHLGDVVRALETVRAAR